MTILAFTQPFTSGTDAKMDFQPARRLPSDRWIGVLLCTGIIGICCASALTGGLSVSTGGVEMNLTGSLSQGLQLQFAAING